MNSVNKNLERYQQQIIRKQRLENITKNLLKEKQELELKINELSNVIFDNESDKENFAGVSLSSVYYNVAGKSMEKVDTGEREKYVVVMKYDLMRNELINIDRDIMRSDNELSCLWGCEKKYLDAILAKVKYLKDIDYERSEEYMELENKIIYLNGQKREMSGAMEIAQVALRAVSSVKIGIDSVKSWGTVESARGNTDVLNKKKQYIDNTQKSIYRMQLVLRKLSTELYDVNISIVDQVAISEFIKFAYSFFTDLFIETDLQTHIISSQYQIKQIYNKINEIIKTLKNKCSIIDEETSKLNKKYKELSGDLKIA